MLIAIEGFLDQIPYMDDDCKGVFCFREVSARYAKELGSIYGLRPFREMKIGDVALYNQGGTWYTVVLSKKPPIVTDTHHYYCP